MNHLLGDDLIIPGKEVKEDKDKRERVYSNGMWSVIKRVTDEGEYFSVVRYGSVFFEHTFKTLTEAINYCDEVI